MRSIRFMVLGLAAFALAACLTSAAPRSSGASEKFEKTYPLSVGGTVSLQNVNGNLKVMTWDKSDVKVEAMKYADDEASLADLRINVDATRDMISIRTHYPDSHGDNHGHGAAVDYVLTVPKGANLDKISVVNGHVDISGLSGDVSVSTVNGDIKALGLGGRCELETVNGTVDAKFVSLRRGVDIRMRTVNGGLVLRLPDKPDADINASTTTGRISNEFGLESSREGGHDSFVRVGARLRGKLGSGGSSISLKTVNGSISILKSESPR